MRTATLFPLCLLSALAPAQDAGLRLDSLAAPDVARLHAPDPMSAERVITIEAVAAVRVPPSRLRVVFSVSANGPSTSAASSSARELVAATQERLRAAGVTAVDVDFIAALPVYRWRVEEQNGKDVVAEFRDGTRVQYNLHAEVRDESAARTAIEAAAADGIDVLAVDYWSDALAQKQVEAQQQALQAAQQKAKLLLAVFPLPPHPINVHESTRVLFPAQLYHRLPAAEDGAGGWYDPHLPRVPTTRPLHVY